MRNSGKVIGSMAALMLLGITQPEHAHQDQDKISRPSYKIGPEIESVRKQLTGVVEKYGGTADLPGISQEFYYLHEPVVVAGKELGLRLLYQLLRRVSLLHPLPCIDWLVRARSIWMLRYRDTCRILQSTSWTVAAR